MTTKTTTTAFVAVALALGQGCGGIPFIEGPAGFAENPTVATDVSAPPIAPPSPTHVAQPSIENVRAAEDQARPAHAGGPTDREHECTKSPAGASPTATTMAQHLNLCNGDLLIELPILPAVTRGPTTVEMWVRTPTGGDQVIFESGALRIDLDRGQIGGRVADAVVRGPLLPTKVWTHVAFVMGPRHLRLYVDGYNVGERPWSAPPTPFVEQDAMIGRATPSGDAFCGEIDNVRIIARDVYTHDFNPATTIAAGPDLVLGYTFDSITKGTIIPDISPHKLDGTIRGKAHFVAGNL